jgi:hypothetical protein
LQSAILLLNINELHQRKKLIYSGDRYTLSIDWQMKKVHTYCNMHITL